MSGETCECLHVIYISKFDGLMVKQNIDHLIFSKM